MSGALIIITGLIYVGVAVDLAWRGNWPLSIAYAGYSFANIGLYLAVKET